MANRIVLGKHEGPGNKNVPLWNRNKVGSFKLLSLLLINGKIDNLESNNIAVHKKFRPPQALDW